MPRLGDFPVHIVPVWGMQTNLEEDIISTAIRNTAEFIKKVTTE